MNLDKEKESFMEKCIKSQMKSGLSEDESRENCEIHWDLLQEGTLKK